MRTGCILVGIIGAFASHPATSAERTIAFDEAVAMALSRNSALARAENETRLAGSAVTQAAVGFLPDVSARASGSKSYERSYGDPGEPLQSSTGESFRASVGSSLTLFDGLANVAGFKAARLDENASRLDLERTRQTVVFTVISGYLAMIEATEQVRVREENLAAEQGQERLVRTLVDGGAKPISDLYQQQAGVASARLALVEAERTLDLSRVDLVQALQLDPAGEYVFEIPALPSRPGDSAPPGLGALLERAFAQRHDLRAAALRVESAGQGRRAAAAGYWPTVSVSADYGASYTSALDHAFGDQLEDRRSASVGFSVSLPLFDRFATRQGVTRARINAENAELSLADTRQEVALQVRRALLDWASAEEAYRAAEAELLAGEKALAITEERYAVGAATLYEVTLARADFVEASSASVSARYNLLWQKRLLDYHVGDLDPSEGLAG